MESFLMRVWVPATAEAGRRPGGLHGLVEHVGFHYRRPFRDESDLLAFVRGCIAETAARATGEASAEATAPDGGAEATEVTDGIVTADVPPPPRYRLTRYLCLGD